MILNISHNSKDFDHTDYSNLKDNENNHGHKNWNNGTITKSFYENKENVDLKLSCWTQQLDKNNVRSQRNENMEKNSNDENSKS